MSKEILNKIDKYLLQQVTGNVSNITSGAYSIRKNGHGFDMKSTENVVITKKEDKPGIDIYVKENYKGESIHIPVILTVSGIKDVVYNDFHIAKNAEVEIIAGCGLHNDEHEDNQHDGIHSFYLEEGAKVRYIEKHYGEGKGDGKRILNPATYVYMKNDSSMDMETIQINGVSDTVRETVAEINENCSLVVNEKIMTSQDEVAKTVFDVKLNGNNSSAHVTSRSVANDMSKQVFVSRIYGNSKCFAHSECDAIIKDQAIVTATPEITATCVDANLIHEAAIGKIAGEQIVKLMSLGLSAKEAEEEIIRGFLK